MIYSKWRPDKGGYDYYEGGDKNVPLGDDLPTPRIPKGTAIGVASIDAGRPLPSGARRVGSGKDAVGLITPISRNGLGVLGNIGVPPQYIYAALGVLVGWWIARKK